MIMNFSEKRISSSESDVMKITEKSLEIKMAYKSNIHIGFVGNNEMKCTEFQFHY